MDKLQQSYLFIPNKFKVMNVLLALLMNPLWTKICNVVPLIPLRFWPLPVTSTWFLLPTPMSPNLILFENTDSFVRLMLKFLFIRNFLPPGNSSYCYSCSSLNVWLIFAHRTVILYLSSMNWLETVSWCFVARVTMCRGK